MSCEHEICYYMFSPARCDKCGKLREEILEEALQSAKAALGDNIESQNLGGKGITKEYYYAVIKEINEALK